MKTKAYKLAAELGMQEQPVLDWLRANGYPNVRRADMIRADVAQAARVALGKHARANRVSGVPVGPSSGRGMNPRRDSAGGLRREADASRTPRAKLDSKGKPRAGFKVSFADLLKDHLPDDGAAPNSGPTGKTVANDINETAVDIVSPFQNGQAADPDVKAVLAKNENDRLREKLSVQQAQITGLERLLDEARSGADGAREVQIKCDQLRLELERYQQDALEVREALKGEAAQREALEQTCAELQRELNDQRDMIQELDSLQGDHDSVLGDLENARQREVAWRKRALELERAAHAGDDLHGIFKKYGLDTGRSQVRALEALLKNERLSGHFLKSIRQVDVTILKKLLSEQLRPTCVHPICQQLTVIANQTPYRVDSDKDCHVCRGEDERRWFAKLVSECERAGIRRLLVVGGRDEVHGRLRSLSEGTSLDLRLMSRNDEANDVRSNGRVEGCDVVVVWSDESVRAQNSHYYIEAARQHGRQVVTVLGPQPGVVSMSKAIVNSAARNQFLSPD